MILLSRASAGFHSLFLASSVTSRINATYTRDSPRDSPRDSRMSPCQSDHGMGMFVACYVRGSRWHNECQTDNGPHNQPRTSSSRL